MNSRIVVGSSPASSTNPVPVYPAAVPSSVTPGDATLTEASKTVAAAGTPEALGVGTFQQVLIFPLRTNTGDAYIGTAATNDTQHGTLPAVLEAPPGKLINIAGLYVDVTVNGEGVRYIGIK